MVEKIMKITGFFSFWTFIQIGILFSAIPGFGRAYYDHKFDGFVSFTYVSGFSYLSYNSFKRKNEVIGIFSGVVALLFWSADIIATNQLSLNLY